MERLGALGSTRTCGRPRAGRPPPDAELRWENFFLKLPGRRLGNFKKKFIEPEALFSKAAPEAHRRRRRRPFKNRRAKAGKS